MLYCFAINFFKSSRVEVCRASPMLYPYWAVYKIPKIAGECNVLVNLFFGIQACHYGDNTFLNFVSFSNKIFKLALPFISHQVGYWTKKGRGCCSLITMSEIKLPVSKFVFNKSSSSQKQSLEITRDLKC